MSLSCSVSTTVLLEKFILTTGSLILLSSLSLSSGAVSGSSSSLSSSSNTGSSSTSNTHNYNSANSGLVNNPNNIVISSGSGSGSNNVVAATNNLLVGEWSRNVESQLTRIGGRLDQLMVRLDILDSKIGRFQSLVQMRFDNMENGLTSTKVQMDFWGDELNRIDEQLTRKWKNIESRFEQLTTSVESKLETKITQMQRDNRRHNEFVSQSLNTIIFNQERLNEKISYSILNVNATLSQVKTALSASSLAQNRSTSSRPYSFSSRTSSQLQPQQSYDSTNVDKIMNLLQDLVSRQQQGQMVVLAYQNQSSQTPHQLLSNKVSNMFEDLRKHTLNLETYLKDAIAIGNITRREVQEGFRSLITSHPRNRHETHGSTSSSSFSSSSGSSSEVMSAVIVEALASVESMSTAMGRRVTELSRSIEERFEMVSMTLNGFLESCLRIQDGAPLIEEHIAHVLERILDTVENSTSAATELWNDVAVQLVEQKNNNSLSYTCLSLPEVAMGVNSSNQSLKEQHGHQHGPSGENHLESDELLNQNLQQRPSSQGSVYQSSHSNGGSGSSTSSDLTRQLILNHSDLSEEDKKALWESLFPNVPE